MRLQVIVPHQIILDQPVIKIVAEAVNGSFCLLPRHIDIVTVLVPGILYFTPPSGIEKFMAIDEGILVKCQADVVLSTLNAVQSDNLATLKKTVSEQFYILEEQEKLTRSALVKLETNIIRHFQEINKL